MPIRTAVAALLLLFALVLFAPATDASPETARRPAAALVAPGRAPDSGRPAGSEELSPLALAALVAGAFIPTILLIARKRQHRPTVE